MIDDIQTFLFKFNFGLQRFLVVGKFNRNFVNKRMTPQAQHISMRVINNF